MKSKVILLLLSLILVSCTNVQKKNNDATFDVDSYDIPFSDIYDPIVFHSDDIKPFYSLPNPNRFNIYTITYKEREYHYLMNNSYTGLHEVDEKCIDTSKIYQSIQYSIFNEFNNQNIDLILEIYKIKKIDIETAIAVKYSYDNSYSFYYSNNNENSTPSEVVNMYNLQEYTHLKYVNYYGDNDYKYIVQLKDFDSNHLIEMLLSSIGLNENYYYKIDENEVTPTIADFTLFYTPNGEEASIDLKFIISRSYYLYIPFCKYAYYIGKSKCNEILQWLFNNSTLSKKRIY